MAWRDAGDREGRDSFTGVTGTFVIHLFGHDGNKRSDMTR